MDWFRLFDVLSWAVLWGVGDDIVYGYAHFEGGHDFQDSGEAGVGDMPVFQLVDPRTGDSCGCCELGLRHVVGDSRILQ